MRIAIEWKVALLLIGPVSGCAPALNNPSDDLSSNAEPIVSPLPASSTTPTTIASPSSGSSPLPRSTPVSLVAASGSFSDFSSALSRTTIAGNFFPQPGYGFSTVTLNLGSSFVAGNICSGSSFFGLAGSATCSPNSTSILIPVEAQMSSNAIRNLGTSPISQSQEVTDYSGSLGPAQAANLPVNYREIPNMNLDDEGYSPIAGNSQYGLRPQVACGSSGSTLAAKIADCATKNGSRATWDGAVKGTMGQGLWKLVFASGQATPGVCSGTANSTDCYEVWQDLRTGLVWSSSTVRYAASTGINFCLASGNAQNIGGNCSAAGGLQYTSGLPGSACSESAETGGVSAVKGICSNGSSITSTGCTGTWYPNQLTKTGALENYTTGIYSLAKGYMGALSTPGVRWRLPTKLDFQQADLDGLRFVMPDTGIAGGSGGRAADGTPGNGNLGEMEYTATIYSGSRSTSWVYFSTGGSLLWGWVGRSSTGVVTRCVGR